MNTNPSRAELLKAIADLGDLHPEWRLGQLLANLATSAGKTDAGAVWDLEDSEALLAARHLLERRRPQCAPT
jgi:hypothetical protein